MSDEGASGPAAIAEEFGDLKQRLASLMKNARPTDDNPHFAAFRHTDDSTLAELTLLAHEGPTRVEDHRACFLRHALYDDGMFWYELFLAISASVLSYEKVRGESPDPRSTYGELRSRPIWESLNMGNVERFDSA